MDETANKNSLELEKDAEDLNWLPILFCYIRDDLVQWVDRYVWLYFLLLPYPSLSPPLASFVPSLNKLGKKKGRDRATLAPAAPRTSDFPSVGSFFGCAASIAACSLAAAALAAFCAAMRATTSSVSFIPVAKAGATKANVAAVVAIDSMA